MAHHLDVRPGDVLFLGGPGSIQPLCDSVYHSFRHVAVVAHGDHGLVAVEGRKTGVETPLLGDVLPGYESVAVAQPARCHGCKTELASTALLSVQREARYSWALLFATGFRTLLEERCPRHLSVVARLGVRALKLLTRHLHANGGMICSTLVADLLRASSCPQCPETAGQRSVDVLAPTELWRSDEFESRLVLRGLSLHANDARLATPRTPVPA
ncbi:MAG: hypothetical protein AAGG01_12360 [Planctomycetota bacterium]